MTSIVAERYAQALYRLTAGADDPRRGQVLRAFARLLQKRGLLAQLEAIAVAFQRYAREEDDRRRLHVTAARPLSDEVRQRFEFHDPRLREAAVTVDPGIIGGMIIRDKSMIMDASIKRQCKELQSRFTQ